MDDILREYRRYSYNPKRHKPNIFERIGNHLPNIIDPIKRMLTPKPDNHQRKRNHRRT
jgi:hypothetical protein